MSTICDSDPRVCIVGPNKFQNKLLVSLIERDTNLPCQDNPDISFFANNEDSQQKRLFLLDCKTPELSEIYSVVHLGDENKTNEFLVALFNAGSDKDFEKETIANGVRGIFYESDPPKLFPKGVIAILNGELWYRRKTLSECVSNPVFPLRSSEKAAVLTPREKEVLIQVTSGKSNQEIADELFIAIHTVKSHLYRIFKKIDVPNRLQATLWSAKHLFKI
ncbi:DNA-binding HTH domain-containing protein, LuxR-type [Desulfonema limicola]|uniref:DNA-binding HTH domain-containing protein, LuxR-type n=1 Tax=Desulfonema limicola TaxID=45656 RepID=A0A975GF08_9BACT|nr:LuxR C-terminal-related transcriptional regulator [Desulfonema limicola]QTA78791.1 DNA-binding HTH domain-containing protein, LuxR-type [Desulfonema limicola]